MNKKKDYVGNHGGAYTDLDGQRKQFTYVDHDIKPKMATGITSALELEEIKQSIKDYRTTLQDRILATPAVYCPSENQDFTLRGEALDKVEWNETMIKDAGMGLDRLQHLCTLLENRMERWNSL